MLPSDVNIIVLTPVEFIMLQVRMSWLGAGLAVLALIIDGAWKVGLQVKHQNWLYLVVLVIVVVLGGLGLVYSWNLLTPLLLDYFANDAQTMAFQLVEIVIICWFHSKPVSGLCDWISAPLINSVCFTQEQSIVYIDCIPQTHLVHHVRSRCSLFSPDLFAIPYFTPNHSAIRDSLILG